jgi:3-hydroxyisobutyrate dehydrogenase
MPKYAFRGPSQIIGAFEPALTAAGFTREGEFDVADVIVTYCIGASALEELYFGEGGIVAMANPGSVVIDLSPTTPNLASETSAVCTISDLQFIEAPLICKNKVAADAFNKENLECYIASENEVPPVAFGFLNAIFGQVEHVGQPGSAQLVRAGITLQNVAETVSVVEAYSLFEAARTSVNGLDTTKLVPAAISSDTTFVLGALADKHFDGVFSIEMLMAEITAAIMAADDYELILPQAEAAFHLIELLAVIGGSDKNSAALALVYGNNTEALEEQGLDWSRAEELYASNAGDGYDDDCCGHDHDYGHAHDEFGRDYDDFDRDQDDDYDYDDDFIEDNFAEGSGFGYSVN